MFNRLQTIPACDRHTDILPLRSPRYAYVSRGKKEETRATEINTRPLYRHGQIKMTVPETKKRAVVSITHARTTQVKLTRLPISKQATRHSSNVSSGCQQEQACFYRASAH